ncbi:MAG: cytochrome c [Candidatus Nitronauta litoralis]|uniref:Cytochrome c n=1 Tax=Candidatus Nitronauta litoralis TaxID=2705533 RepID=A0A7T0BTX9_9BACT|nr:MAG: cytochrome c [Candidatus Nitronauta litoralis]
MDNVLKKTIFFLQAFIVMLCLSFSFTGQSIAADSIFKKNKCTQCHRLSPDTPLEQRKGPDLFFAGDKFQASWLVNWLQQPDPIRLSGFIADAGFLKGKPSIATPHPKLEKESAETIVENLMKLKSGALENTPTAELEEPLSKGKRFKFKILFEREYGCISCHQSVNLAGQPRGGVSGPILLDAGDRLNAGWVYHWLKNPEVFEKRGRMPRFKLNEEELKALTRYVMWHKKSGDKK